MGHICPNCFKGAPILFGFCPECDFDMKDCRENGCDHCWSTRDKMISKAKKKEKREPLE